MYFTPQTLKPGLRTWS